MFGLCFVCFCGSFCLYIDNKYTEIYIYPFAPVWETREICACANTEGGLGLGGEKPTRPPNKPIIEALVTFFV